MVTGMFVLELNRTKIVSLPDLLAAAILLFLH